MESAKWLGDEPEPSGPSLQRRRKNKIQAVDEYQEEDQSGPELLPVTTSDLPVVVEAFIEPPPGLRPPPGLECFRLSDQEMADLWQQAALDAKEIMEPMESTEAEDQSEPSDVHSDKLPEEEITPEASIAKPQKDVAGVVAEKVFLTAEVLQPCEEKADIANVEEGEGPMLETSPMKVEEPILSEERAEEEDLPQEDHEEVMEEMEEEEILDADEQEDDDEMVTHVASARSDAKSKKKKKAPKKSSGNSHPRPKPAQVPLAKSRERTRQTKQFLDDEDVLKDVPLRRKTSFGPRHVFLVILVAAVFCIFFVPWIKRTSQGEGHKTMASKNHDSLPEYCASEMPSNVRLVAQGKFPPEAETPGILPRISLHSSCIWDGYSQAAKKWAPSAQWYWKKIRHGDPEKLEIQHPYEKALTILNTTSSERRNEKVRGRVFVTLAHYILPLFGELNEQSYGFYQQQYGSGLVVLFPDPETHITLAKAQAHWRSTFEGLAQVLNPKYHMVYASSFDQLSREWIRQEFGVTEFPAVAIRPPTDPFPQDRRDVGWTRPWHVFMGDITHENLLLQIKDLEAGCLTWTSTARFYGRT